MGEVEARSAEGEGDWAGTLLLPVRAMHAVAGTVSLSQNDTCRTKKGMSAIPVMECKKARLPARRSRAPSRVGQVLGLLLPLLIWTASSAHAADLKPQPTPRLFVTVNHGLVVTFPAGLTYCPLPAGWIGSDHGTEVYLLPPQQCGVARGYPSSARLPEPRVPVISIVYAYNFADNHRADGEVSPPRIDQELAGTVCAAGSLPLPADIRLQDGPRGVLSSATVSL